MRTKWAAAFTTTYSIGEDDRLQDVIDPYGNLTQLSYSLSGDINQIVDARGNATFYSHDPDDGLP